MTQEALKLARQLLWRYRHEIPIGHQPYMICHQVDEAFERIDEALARPEQEPVKYSDYEPDGVHHTTPPQRTWVGLTDEEMTHTNHHMVEGAYQYSFKQGAKWAEAKLKERNT